MPFRNRSRAVARVTCARSSADSQRSRLVIRILLLAAVGACALVQLSAVARGDVYVSDGDRIGRYDNNGTLINANFIPLLGATGLTIGPDGYLYAASGLGYNFAPAILRYDANTGAQIGGPFVAYQGQPPTPDPHDVIDPQGLRFGSNGNLYVADLNVTTQNVHVYDGTGNSLGSLNSPLLSGPRAVAFDAQSPQHLYVTSGGSVLQYDFGTQSFSTFTQSNPADPSHLPLNDAKDLAFGPDHKLYVLDWSNATPDIVRFNADGSYDSLLVNFAPTTFFPAGLAIGPDSKLYVSGYDALDSGGSVLRFNLDGTPDGTFIAAGSLTYYDSFMVITPEPSAALLLTLAGTLALRRR